MDSSTLPGQRRISALLLLDTEPVWDGCEMLHIEALSSIDQCWNLVSQDAATIVVIAGSLLPDGDTDWASTVAALVGPVVVVSDDAEERAAAAACGVAQVLPRSFLDAPPDLALAILREHALRKCRARDDLEMYMRDSIHEFRTPLTTMIEFASLLEDGIGGPLTEKQESYLGHMLRAGMRQLEQFDDYRDGLRIRLGSLRRKPQRVELRDLLEELSAARRAEEGFSATGTEDSVHVDPQLYANTLARLIDSARKLGTKGTPISVTARCFDNRFETHVEYDGPLPSQDDQRVVAEGLVEHNGYYRSIARVLGLGVALCDNFARTCGGSLALQTRGDLGGSFVLALPLHDLTDAA